MYDVDKRDRVTELAGVPQSSVGSPTPVVLADEGKLVLAYCLQSPPGPFVIEDDDEGEPVALVKFATCYAHMFGPPNDEAFAGHPLASRGLSPYGAFEVIDSSWIRRLEKMNSVHPGHRPERYWKRRHLIFTFHERTFECVCDGFEVFRTQGLIETIVPQMMKLLEWSEA